ncbi:uncharacterized protein SCHCODRAFT_01051240, partial [Schizophyllum commune H4-8]|uniref:uncharacterized protein n=1 Tax=Schizophyllum commune (strain H4-8 / FGSC 9210) TaxID=578458 RepID=UPI002160CC42
MADELFAVAYNVAVAKSKNSAPQTYAFPPRDSIVSRKPPPSPCRACGSRKHWNRDCPHWQQFLLQQKKEGFLVNSDPEGDRAYNAAYSVVSQGFERAAPESSLTKASDERKTQTEDRKAEEDMGKDPKEMSDGRREVYEVKHQSFAVTVEEVGEEYWYRGEMLPTDSPHLLEHVDEVSEPVRERWGAISETLAEGVRAEALTTEPAPEPTDRPPDAGRTLPDPRPYEPPKVRLIARKKVKSLSGKGSAVLCVFGFLGSEGEVRVLLRFDSCASLSLISGATYDSMKNPPPLKQGAKMRLWQLTDKTVSIRGYIHQPVLMRADDGTLLEAEAELYVVDGMTVPILLGEDFQQKYEVSVNRSLEEGTTITFGQLPSPITAHGTQRTSDYDEVERAYGARRARARRATLCDNTLRAARKVIIRPETVVNIPVSGPFDTPGDWIVERSLLTSGEQRPFAVPNVLLSSSRPTLPIANLSTTPRVIQEGEALATVERAQDFFDKPKSDEDLRR